MKTKIFFAITFSFIVGSSAFACDAHTNTQKQNQTKKTVNTEVKAGQTVVASQAPKSVTAPAQPEKSAK